MVAIRIRKEVSHEGYVPFKEAAEQLGLQRGSVYRYVKNGRLVSFKDMDNRIWVQQESLNSLIEERRNRPARAAGAGRSYTYTYVPSSVRSLKGAIRQVQKAVEDSPEKDACLAVLRAVLDVAVDNWMAAKAEAAEPMFTFPENS